MKELSERYKRDYRAGFIAGWRAGVVVARERLAEVLEDFDEDAEAPVDSIDWDPNLKVVNAS